MEQHAQNVLITVFYKRKSKVLANSGKEKICDAHKKE
jgi:hypothetical protein